MSVARARDLRPDPVAVEARRRIDRGGRRRSGPFRLLLDVADRLHPAGTEGGVDVIAVRRRPGDADEMIGAVGVLLDRTGLGAHLHEARLGRNHAPRHREAGEVVPDEQRHGLAEIERGLAGGDEEVAGVEARHRDLRRGEVGGEHHPVGPELGRQQIEVDPLEEVGGVGGLDEERVPGLRRPARHVRRRGNRRRKSSRRRLWRSPRSAAWRRRARTARPARRSAAAPTFPEKAWANAS